MANTRVLSLIEHPRPLLQRVAIATASTLGGLALYFAFASLQGDASAVRATAPVLLIAIVVSAWWGGVVAGVFSTAMAAGGAMIIPSIIAGRTSLSGGSQMFGVLLIEGLIITALCAIAQHPRSRITKARADQVSELTRAEERYRTLVHAANAIVWVADARGEVREARGWKEMTGQEADDYVGAGWTAAVHPDDLAAVTNDWARSVRDSVGCDIQYRIRTHHGAYRYVRVRGTPLFNPDRSVREWIGSVVDIDDRKRVELSLVRKEAELKLVIDATPAFICYFDRNLVCGLVNRRYAEWFDSTPEQLRDRPLADVLGAGSFAKLQPALERALAGEHVRFDYADRDGRWFDVSYTPHTDEAGAVIGGVALIHDITDRKRFEDERVESLARYRFLASAMPQIVWTADRTGQLDYVNERWYQLSGLTPEATFAGDGWLHIMHPDDLEATAASWRRAIEQGTVYECEHRLRDTRGVYRWYLSRAIPRTEGAGGIVQWVGSCTDIDDQRRAYAALAVAREELRRHAVDLEGRVLERTRNLNEVNAELEAFAYGVSHDLRNPLHIVRGYIDAIVTERANVICAESRDHANRILRSVDRMERIITDLYQYSRAFRGELQLAPLSLEQLAEEVVAHHQIEIQRSGARVTVHTPLAEVRGDRTGLFQSMSNLVGNALKFTLRGEAPVIDLRTERRGELVRLWIEDRGLGIDPAQHERIFKLFERLHGANEYPGTGIGLSLVRKAVLRMGGACGVESSGREGSRFWIDLPAVVTAA